jgi:hypothetical protein
MPRALGLFARFELSMRLSTRAPSAGGHAFFAHAVLPVGRKPLAAQLRIRKNDSSRERVAMLDKTASNHGREDVSVSAKSCPRNHFCYNSLSISI